MKRLALLLSILILTGCMMVNPKDPVVIEQMTTVERNEHQQSTWYYAPPYPAMGSSYRLRANVSKSRTFYQIYVFAVFDDWAFVDRAYSNGKKLNLTQIDKEVGYCGGSNGCDIYETVAINLTKAQLKSYAKTGFSFQVAGRGGQRDFDMPAEYFQGFLNALESK